MPRLAFQQFCGRCDVDLDPIVNLALEVVAKMVWIQHAVVVKSFQTDCDVSICSRNNAVSLDVPEMSKSSMYANTMMFFFTQIHLSDVN